MAIAPNPYPKPPTGERVEFTTSPTGFVMASLFDSHNHMLCATQWRETRPETERDLRQIACMSALWCALNPLPSEQADA